MLNFPRHFSSRRELVAHVAELWAVDAQELDDSLDALDLGFDSQEQFDAFLADIWEECFPGVEYQG
jgi:hypothetical protein